MSFDVKATMEQPTSAVSGSGGVTEAWEVTGTLYLERVRVGIAEVVTASREAQQLDRVYRSRFHSLLTQRTRLVIDGHRYRIGRMDELGRRKGWTLYLNLTEAE